MTSTIFLKFPTGVAIETEDSDVEQSYILALHQETAFSVTRRRDQSKLIIPADNVASIEIR